MHCNETLLGLRIVYIICSFFLSSTVTVEKLLLQFHFYSSSEHTTQFSEELTVRFVEKCQFSCNLMKMKNFHIRGWGIPFPILSPWVWMAVKSAFRLLSLATFTTVCEKTDGDIEITSIDSYSKRGDGLSNDTKISPPT